MIHYAHLSIADFAVTQR